MLSQEIDKQALLRRIILVLSVIGLVSTFSSCANVWTGYETYTFPISYLLLLISTVLVAAKIRGGYFLLLLISVAWAFQLTETFGWFFTFRTDESPLYLLILIPFLAFLLLIPLTTKYLTLNNLYKKFLLIISLLLALSFPIYEVVSRANRDYGTSVFAEFKIEDSSVNLTFKPQPSDTRQIFLKANARELIEAIKNKGTCLSENACNDEYYVSNTGIRLKFKFNKLQSITLLRLEDEELDSSIAWTKEDINGDTSFLTP